MRFKIEFGTLDLRPPASLNASAILPSKSKTLEPEGDPE